MKSKFIVLEGVDGSGKTTQALKINNYIFEKDKRNNVLITREPSYSGYGLEVRRMLKEGKDPKANKERFTELFVNDRKWHLDNIVIPALGNGIHVVCDRYKYSTLVYQQAQGVPLKTLIEMHHGLLIPDITFYLDIPIEIALTRIVANEVFEKEGFLREIKKNYLNLIDTLRDKIVRIDTSDSIDKVFENIKVHLDRIL